MNWSEPVILIEYQYSVAEEVFIMSLGVTGYERDTFQVYHRLYDVLNITVISDKDTVGFYDMGTTAAVYDRQVTTE